METNLLNETMAVLLHQRALCWPLSCWCVLITATACAESGTRTSSPMAAGPTVSANSSSRTLVAEPKPQDASPFLPSINRNLRYPVAIEGFCIVSLRERQKWVPGSESHQLMFDEKLYWFAGQRERAIFAATPQRYVPALGGDCVVTFRDTGDRQPGTPHYGVLHDHRLFFFQGMAEQEKFQSKPSDYDKTDLANEGRCLVSHIDAQQQLPGLPETTVIVDGLRYQFAGVHQQRSFLANMQQYGVTPPKAPPPKKKVEKEVANASPFLAQKGFSRSKKTTKDELSEKTIEGKVLPRAMGGYCPVTIREKGTWTVGEDRSWVQFDGYTYLMAGELERKQFSENPHIFLPALGGHCVVTEIDSNRRVSGSIYHAAWHEGAHKLFLFAGVEQKQAFNANPERYLNADLVANGNCPVTLIDEGREVAGLPELLIWHHSKRYLFASPEQQAKFRENTQRYQDR